MAHEYATDSGKMRVVKGHNSPPDTVEMSKPGFHITSKDLPELKNWKVGEKYKLELEVMQKHAGSRAEGVVEGYFVIDKIKAL